MTRNVRWHEERQDRADESAERLGRRALKELYRSQDFEKKAAQHQMNARQSLRKGHHKKAARETALAEEALKKAQTAAARSRRLADKAAEVRKSGARYGRAKTRIGVYNAPGRSGWSDRDARRRR